MKKPTLDQQVHEANRLSWNAATVAHNSHKADQAGFLRGGGSTLFPEELDLLGDLEGKHLVHLQCNAGQDTLSLASRGATVTGVDISDEAIAFATELSFDADIHATFIRSDVYDWFDAARKKDETFDIAFVSYGAVCWLSDLNRWARGVNGVLSPGGRLVIVDFHPVLMMFDEQLRLRYPYFSSQPPQKWDEGVGDYVAMSGASLTPSGYLPGIPDFENPHPVYEYQWHLSALIGALLGAGLTLTRFEEYPYLNGVRFLDQMREASNRRFFLPDDVPGIPLMYGITALKKTTD